MNPIKKYTEHQIKEVFWRTFIKDQNIHWDSRWDDFIGDLKMIEEWEEKNERVKT